ncbi:hypothetical protein BT69DRAFT_1340551 [Atractiella rhizophila]|nr:hypothetical protein BT69DRAFT_1340551 [Atractiella rhizophila]
MLSKIFTGSSSNAGTNPTTTSPSSKSTATPSTRPSFTLHRQRHSKTSNELSPSAYFTPTSPSNAHPHSLAAFDQLLTKGDTKHISLSNELEDPPSSPEVLREVETPKTATSFGVGVGVKEGGGSPLYNLYSQSQKNVSSLNSSAKGKLSSPSTPNLASPQQSFIDHPPPLPPPLPSKGSSSTYYDAEEDMDHRRSIYRSPGTASSPDLKTLIKKAKASPNPSPINTPNVNSNAASLSPREKERDGYCHNTEKEDPISHRSSSRHPPPPPRPSFQEKEKEKQPPLPTADPTRTLDHDPQLFRPRLPPPPAGAAPPNHPHPSSHSSHAHAHVQVPFPPSPSASPVPGQGMRRGSGSGSGSGSFDRGAGGAMAMGVEEEEEGGRRERQSSMGKKGFQNTMRKTSGFFRKRFGPSQSPSAQSSPTTIHTTSYPPSAPSSPPPVPSVPHTYQNTLKKPRQNHSRNSGSIERLDSPVSPSAAREGRHLSPQDRRRSMSFNSGTASALSQLLNKVAAGGSSNLEYKARDEETFKQDVQNWEDDLDDIFAKIGKSYVLENQRSSFTPPVARNVRVVESAPVTPMNDSGERGRNRASLDQERERVESGGERRRPAVWDQKWNLSPSPSAGNVNNLSPTTAGGLYRNKILSHSTSALPTSGSSSSVGSSNTGLGISGVDGSVEDPANVPPSIRLVPNSPHTPLQNGDSGSDPDMIKRLRNELRNTSAQGLGSPSSKRLSYIGAGLEPIREAHSRENSVATPTSLVIPGEDGRRPFPPDKRRASMIEASPSGSPKFDVPTITQSPASAQPSSFKIPPLPPNRKATRSSISGYPTSPSTTRSASASNSFSTSVTSLESDKAKRDLMEDELKFAGNRSASPGGTSLEDKARELALKAWHEEEGFLKREKIAEWLGGINRLNKAACTAYLELFDFAGLRMDAAFRKLCEKLYLKAETQQIDRILDEFSKRYWNQNRGLIYGSSDIVHVIAYSLLMLNTDLHIVDSPTHMSRAQFIKNTMSAIHSHRSQSISRNGTPDPVSGSNPSVSALDDDCSVHTGEEVSNIRRSLERLKETIANNPASASKVRSQRTGSIGSWQTPPQLESPEASSVHLPTRKGSGTVNTSLQDLRHRRSGSLTRTGAAVRDRWWDGEVETLLKEMYTAVKSQPIFMIASSSNLLLPDARTSMSLTSGSPYGTWGGVTRSGSRRSANSYGTDRNKRTSLRNFGNFLGPGHEIGRPASPAFSSFSDEMGDTNAYSARQPATIGFASNLTTTIIREQQEDDAASESGQSITEEELALMGAPWAKEGLLHRKHYWESTNKRSKDKNWTQCFVVISKGEMQMFKFGEGGGGGMSSAMGGGNWLTNAQSLGDISLIHALCSALPPPGYSRDRPHVLVLTLSNGGSYFFQAGTEDLVNEWVMTCNYWAARLSREPQEGVSNHEYGWGRVDLDREPQEEHIGRPSSVKSGKSGKSRKSMSNSGHVGGFYNPNDKIVIGEWKPPIIPFTKTNLEEDEQLESLKRHLATMKVDLDKHQELRGPMMRLFSPRSQNGQKALANWEKKSKWLLAEIVKFETYIEVLERSVKLRNKKRDEKRVEELLKVADAADDADAAMAMESQREQDMEEDYELDPDKTLEQMPSTQYRPNSRTSDPPRSPTSPREPMSPISSTGAYPPRTFTHPEQSFQRQSIGHREPVSPRERESEPGPPRERERPPPLGLAVKRSSAMTGSTVASTVDEFFDFSPQSGKSSFDKA